MTLTAGWQHRWQAALMNNYGTPAVALVRGSGAHVWDVDGIEYVDFVAGIAVNALGHGHPAVVEAVSRQVATLGHTSNLAINPTAVELAERLLGLFDRPGRVFFCNSGAEATEAALKLTRRTGRTTVVAAEGSFHGRTLGALGVTGQKGKRAPFLPLFGSAAFVPFGDPQALAQAVDPATAAVLLEPIQGEGGVVPAPAGYLASAQDIAAKSGALFILDEVQTGIGRTGAWYAHQPLGLLPDIVTLAKGLGGGLPIGACIAFGDTAELFEPGQHGSTFGGNPIAAAAALAVLDTIERDGLLARVCDLSGRIIGAVEGLPLVSSVRGSGLLLGLVLTEPVAVQVELAMRANGVLVNAVAPAVIRLAPPLVLTDSDVDRFLSALAASLIAVSNESAVSL